MQHNNLFNTLQVVVKSTSQTKTFSPQDPMKTAIVNLCQRPEKSGASLLRTDARRSIIKHTFKVLHNDLAFLGTKDALSLLTRGKMSDVIRLPWKQVWSEVELSAPTLHAAFTQLVPVQKRRAAVPALCTIVAMLLKLRNRKAKFIQTAISLLLHGGGAKSKVRRLSLISACILCSLLPICPCTDT